MLSSKPNSLAVQSTPRFQRIQALRFFAAAAVVVYHTQLTVGSYFPKQPRFPILEFGANGVDLFFVISGFIIFYIGSTRETAASVFIVRRVERIVPMYWAVTALTFALSYVPGVARSEAPSVLHLFQSLLFVSWINGFTAYPVLNVGWTLEYEMLFYAIAATAMALTKKPWAFAGAVMLALVVIGRGTPFFLQNPIIIEFVFGMTIASFLYQRRLFPWLLIGTVLVVATLPMVGPAGRVWTFGLASVVVVAVAIVLDLRTEYRGSILPELGNASYSIYLVHVLVISLACKIMARLAPTISALVVIPIVSLFSIMVGYVVYWAIEKRLIAAFHRNRRLGRASTPVETA